MQDLKYYSTNPLPFKTLSDFMRFNLYLNGIVLGVNLDFARKEVIKAENPGCIIEKIGDEEGYRNYNLNREYESNRLRAEFFEDLAFDFGVKDNAKLKQLERIITNKEGFSDFESMFILYSELVELIK